ncbi:hypothetical protein MMC07_001432 [Pseudocyphellaria aurata]|nr:hypothetical protein [Pseudocyphellaria aurata]
MIVILLGSHLSARLSRKPASGALRREDYVKEVRMGRWTAQPGLIGNKSDGEDKGAKKLAHDGVVCFVIAASSNHPLGLRAPGFADIGRYFGEMWKDAEKRREELGFLGRSTGLLAQTPTSTTRVVLSYWRSVDGLQAFACGPVHREGWNWWNGTVREHPHLGIMHEVYAAPPGAWENIYVNFVPFGMGESSRVLYSLFFTPLRIFIGPIGETESVVNTADEPERKSTLVRASRKEWKSMLGRMGRMVE